MNLGGKKEKISNPHVREQRGNTLKLENREGK